MSLIKRFNTRSHQSGVDSESFGSNHTLQRKLLPFEAARMMHDRSAQFPFGVKKSAPAKTPIPAGSIQLNQVIRGHSPMMHSVSLMQQSMQGVNLALRAYQSYMQTRQKAIEAAKKQREFVQKAMKGTPKLKTHSIETENFPTGSLAVLKLNVPGVIEGASLKLTLTEFNYTDKNGNVSSKPGYKIEHDKLGELLKALDEKIATLKPESESVLLEIAKGCANLLKPYFAASALLTLAPEDRFLAYCKAQKLTVEGIFQSGALMLDPESGEPTKDAQFLIGRDDTRAGQLYCFQKQALSNTVESLSELCTNLSAISDQWNMQVQKMYQTYNYLCQSASQAQTLGASLGKAMFQNWK